MKQILIALLRGQVNAYNFFIEIGGGVEISFNCAFYSYDHGFGPDKNISEQPFYTKGRIVVDDNIWLKVGVIVLSSERIDKGAVVEAGSVVTNNIPDGGVAIGAPSRVIKMRKDISLKI